MIDIKRFVCNPFQENCYVVSDDTKEAVIIDCGALFEEEVRAIKAYIHDNNLQPKRLIATHAHVDHNFGNAHMFKEYGLKPEVNASDEQLMQQLDKQAMAFCGMRLDTEQPPVGRYFSDNDTVSFGSHTLRIMQTPGHTPGSVFFVCDDEGVAFSGDTLFRQSVGRTDLAMGNWDDIVESLNAKVAKLPKDTIVLPGHGPQTTIADELASNPYLR